MTEGEAPDQPTDPEQAFIDVHAGAAYRGFLFADRVVQSVDF